MTEKEKEMNCREAGKWMSRRIDGELPRAQADLLDEHMSSCPSCTREVRLLTIPRRIGRSLPVLEPSAYFYQRIRANLELEAVRNAFWKIVMGLSRQVVLPLGAVTLMLITAFLYAQLSVPKADVYQTYDRIFAPVSHPEQIVRAERGEITDDVVLYTLAEQEQDGQAGRHLGTAPPK
jgi:anti-sigma factor RsiW